MSQTKQSKPLQFSIQGEFITQLAREKCFLEKDIPYAIKLLKSCMMAEGQSKGELLESIIDVLEGRAELAGTYPGEDYGLYKTPEKENKNALMELLDTIKEKEESKKEQIELLQEKITFIREIIPNHYLSEIDTAWRSQNPYEEEEPTIFGTEPDPVIPIPTASPLTKRSSLTPQSPDMEKLLSPIPGLKNQRDTSGMLYSYITRMKDSRDDDYGFLFPDGTFHPVEWGRHTGWAHDWLEEHDEEYLEKCKNDPSYFGNEKALEWIFEKYRALLLHSPYMGIAEVSKSENHLLTKRQKEYLINYYERRDLPEYADKVHDII